VNRPSVRRPPAPGPRAADPPGPGAARLLAGFGDGLRSRDDFARAADAAETLLDDPVHQAEARTMYGVCLIVAGRRADARRFLDGLVAGGREPGWPKYLLSLLAALEGRDAEARGLWAEALGEDPSLAEHGPPFAPPA
jgi:hypothetical protein